MSKRIEANTDYLGTSPFLGLTEEEASLRVKAGLSNAPKRNEGKGYWAILKNNVCDLFTLFLFAIAILFFVYSRVLISNGYEEEAARYFGFSKYFYLLPLVFNIVIGTITEIRSKRVLDKMKLVNAGRITVLREGEKIKLRSQELVLGDIVFFSSGEQIVADAKMLEGDIEVDESLLSGESTPIRKQGKGATLYSGSIISSGACKAIVTAVGEYTYASSLSKKVKEIKPEKSELMRNIHGLLNILSFVLLLVVAIVVGTLSLKIAIHGDDSSVFNPALSLTDPRAWAKIISTASAFAIGVIPTGLVLVTSMTLAVSIIDLSKKQTLVQELYSLENLSRVDLVCLDKTGTLTDGTMRVKETCYCASKEDADAYLGAILGNTKSFNATSSALAETFKPIQMNIAEEIPFSSARKYSGIVLKSGKEVLLGAPEYLLRAFPDLLRKCEDCQKEGLRALALTYDGIPQALYFLEDRIRPSAKQTISYFYQNGVDVKIISGDSPLTVSKIASLCGIKNADRAISLEGKSLEETKALAKDYVIFARVSPEQKEALVEALQGQGHKVAMTGDGVNDILALRKANSSITFARATDAAKACSDVVLMDNDFSHLIDVVLQGRKVVNNIQRSAILFLTKTVFIFLLSFFTIPFKQGQLFFTIENVYIFEQAVIGIGGFLLSLEPSNKPIEGSFFPKVFPSAIAGGVLMLILAMIPMGLCQCGILTQENTVASISILSMIGGLTVMFSLSMPFTKYRAVVFSVSLLASFILAFGAPTTYIGGKSTTLKMIFGGEGSTSLAFWREFFQPWNCAVFKNLETQSWAIWIYLGALFLSYPLSYGIRNLIKFLLQKATKKKENA